MKIRSLSDLKLNNNPPKSCPSILNHPSNFVAKAILQPNNSLFQTLVTIHYLKNTKSDDEGKYF